MRNIFMKIKKLLLLSTMAFAPITMCGCDLFEGKGDIEKYQGMYVLETANKRTYHVSWGNEKLTGESTIMSKCGFIIKSDKSVEFTDASGNVTTGRVKVLEKYCRFYGTPLDSSHKYYIRSSSKLAYSHETFHMSVEYDVTYTSIIFAKVL